MQLGVRKWQLLLDIGLHNKIPFKIRKIIHCKTVVKPECPYGVDTLILIRNYDIEFIQKKVR